MSDAPLFDFIVNSIKLLDQMAGGIENFHLTFLISLLSFSGIQPDTTRCQPGYVFEFASGAFVPEFEAVGPRLEGEEARTIPFLARLNFSNMKCLRLTAANRRQILYGILNYYSYHFPTLGSLKSPEILREIFE